MHCSLYRTDSLFPPGQNDPGRIVCGEGGGRLSGVSAGLDGAVRIGSAPIGSLCFSIAS